MSAQLLTFQTYLAIKAILIVQIFCMPVDVAIQATTITG